jgi:AcrR family transcriptional regulator
MEARTGGAAAHGATARTGSRRRIRRTPEAAEREILDAAEALLAERPYRELSVDELMRRTGMTRSSFYHYFRSLDEIAVALLRRVQAEMMEAVEPWLRSAAETDDMATNIEQGLLGVTRVFARHGKVLAAIDEAAHHHRTVEQSWRETVLNPWIAAVAVQIRANQERGHTSVDEPEEVARALLLMNMAVFVERLGREPADPPEAVARTLARVWTGTLYPEGLLARS